MNKYARLYSTELSKLIKQAQKGRYVAPNGPSSFNPISAFQNAVGDATTGVMNASDKSRKFISGIGNAFTGKQSLDDKLNANFVRASTQPGKLSPSPAPSATPAPSAAPAAAPAPFAPASLSLGGTSPAPFAPASLSLGGTSPSPAAAPAGPDDAFLKKTMGSYNPKSDLDRRKADAIRKIYTPGMSSNQVYADKNYSSIR